MNGTRSTFMRKGYLLTALAAAVLLAASSGTAYAQSVGFMGNSGMVAENATDADDTPTALTVTVRATDVDRTNDDGTARTDIAGADTDQLGDVTLGIDGDIVVMMGTSTVADDGSISGGFADGNDVKLTILPSTGASDDDWVDGSATLTLSSSNSSTNLPQRSFSITIEDDETAPVVIFNPGSISLTEDSRRDVSLGLAEGATGAGIPGDASSHAGVITLMVSPAGAVGLGSSGCDTDGAAVYVDGLTSPTVSADGGTITTTGAYGSLMTAVSLEIGACPDMEGFKDPMVSLGFEATSLVSATVGDIMPGAALQIHVQSDEEIPVVGFVPTALSLDEGESNTVSIYADGEQGTEVGMVTVSMTGDAMLSLAGDAVTANDDGSYAIDMTGTANVRFMVVSESDPALEDGMTATGWLTIMDANGATIGDDDTVAVTVNGSTSVPALPLVGQLLLALFLMAGGARLYRRRQQG